MLEVIWNGKPLDSTLERRCAFRTRLEVSLGRPAWLLEGKLTEPGCSRYAARGPVESCTAENERLRKLDEGVEKHGWRMLVVTKLVPLFPFNLQSYAYGLTKIRLGTDSLLTARA